MRVIPHDFPTPPAASVLWARLLARQRPAGQCVLVDEVERRALIERHWDFGATDQVVADEIYHDDAVLEFPQSGERFEGVENFRDWRASTLRMSHSRCDGCGEMETCGSRRTRLATTVAHGCQP